MAYSIYFTIFFTILLCSSCNSSRPRENYIRYHYNRSAIEKSKYTISNIELYENSPVWPLAIAVYEQDTECIFKIFINDTSLINIQESKYDINLLEWAVYNHRYYSALALLKSHANPNMGDAGGFTAFSLAAWNKDNPDYLKLISSFVKTEKPIISKKDTTGFYNGPMAFAAGISLENVKALVEAGVKIDTAYGRPISEACSHGKLDVVKYLVIDCKADYHVPIWQGDSTQLLDYLYKSKYREKSDEKIKNEIIKYITEHDTSIHISY